MTTSTPNVAVTALQTFEARAVAFFQKIETGVESFIADFLPTAENLLEVAFEDLAVIAGQAVMQAAPLAISGQEKFGTAVVNVIQTVEKAGQTVAVSTAQAAVQAAYLSATTVAVQAVAAKASS